MKLNIVQLASYPADATASKQLFKTAKISLSTYVSTFIRNIRVSTAFELPYIDVSLLRYCVLICKGVILPQAPRLLSGCCFCCSASQTSVNTFINRGGRPHLPLLLHGLWCFYRVLRNTLCILFLTIVYKTMSSWSEVYLFQ